MKRRLNNDSIHINYQFNQSIFTYIYALSIQNIYRINGGVKEMISIETPQIGYLIIQQSEEFNYLCSTIHDTRIFLRDLKEYYPNKMMMVKKIEFKELKDFEDIKEFE